MRFYEFGRWGAPVLLLLPGTCCHYKANFGRVIPLLREDYHVVCASYDGFDEAEDAVFPDMQTEAERIEAFLQKGFGGRICAAYGCSLGGSMAGLLVQRGNVHIDHAILGSSDLDQAGGLCARAQAFIVSRVIFRIIRTGRLPGWMQKRLEKKPAEDRAYYDEMISLFTAGGQGLSFVRRESIYNQFYSDLVTPLEDDIHVPGTAVHIFYAQKMGETYLERYRRHFRSPDIRVHPLQHEELLMRFPERWAQEVRSCTFGTRKGR